MSLEEMSTRLVQLNGAVNALMSQIRSFETRIQKVELERGVANAVVEEENARAPINERELSEISRLPDSVKELQAFDGNPVQYVSWVHSVESILKDYEVVKTKPIFRAILQAIRQKIRGNADTALISYNIFDDSWPKIKECLSLHYADKRDLSTLEHQLNQLSQRNSKLDEFYASVNHQLSLIINKIKTESYSEETVRVLVETYRNRALDIFVRGLHGDLSRMLVIRRPETLPEAYTACLEIQNLNYRSNSLHDMLARNSLTAPVNQFTSRERRPPQLPPRVFNRFQNRTFYPPRGEQPPPLGPKPAERMDVDRSIQSRQVNYMNRPSERREARSFNNSGIHKRQRLYNIQGTSDESCLNETEDAEGNFLMGASPAFHI